MADAEFAALEQNIAAAGNGGLAVTPPLQAAHSLHGSKAAYRRAVTELLFFASVGDKTRCQRICDAWKIDVNKEECRDYDKRTPMHLAAAEGCYSVVEWLLKDCKCNPNPIDRFKRTPLEDAVNGDHGEVVQLLTSNGAQLLEDGQLVPYQASSKSGYVRVFDKMELQPEFEVDPEDLQLDNKVGEGEFGAVYKGRWNKTTVAIKVLRRSDAVALGDFRTELNVLQKIHHPHTVQFLGACTRKQPYMIVTEFLPGGSLADLFKRINSNQGGIPSQRRGIELALGCAKGMLYLHSRNKNVIIHRDLKPANLMLGGVPFDSGSRDLAQKTGFVKIADFGLSRSLAINKAHSKTDDAKAVEADRYKMTGETGSYRYMAPEVFRSEPYNAKVDVYAFSMILFELLEGYIPFLSIHPVEAAKQAALENKRPIFDKQNRWHQTVPPSLQALTKQCWDADFDKRPEFAEVCDVLQAALDKLPLDKKGGGAASASAAGSSGGSEGGCCTIM